MSHLRAQDVPVPANIQSMVQEASIKSAQATTTAMHKAVTKLGVAKRNLQQARDARLNLNTAWKAFVQQNVQKWEGYLKDFGQQDQKSIADLQAAQEALKQAKAGLEEAKLEATKEEMRDFQESAEDEMDDVEADTTTQVHIQELAQHLHQIAKRAEEGLASCSYGPAKARLGVPQVAPYAETTPEGGELPKETQHFS